jgi:hypothetical protein
VDQDGDAAYQTMTAARIAAHSTLILREYPDVARFHNKTSKDTAFVKPRDELTVKLHCSHSLQSFCQ